nr:hypothetical protein [Tanacetum cinerariifolium]
NYSQKYEDPYDLFILMLFCLFCSCCPKGALRTKTIGSELGLSWSLSKQIDPNSGDFTMDVVKDISLTREPRVHNALPTLQLILEFKLSSESLFTYVVWIFLPFLLY